MNAWLSRLSAREVLSLIGEGKFNQEIAARLDISPATARTYVSRLLSKLDARDRAQLVVAAYQGGSSAESSDTVDRATVIDRRNPPGSSPSRFRADS